MQEYDDLRNTNLAGKKDMLLRLSHNTIGCSNNKDCAIHLSCASDHVLDIVSMAWAVDMSIMSLLGLILDMSGRNRDTTLSFLRSLIDLIECLECIARDPLCKDSRDCSGQGCFTMVDMSDGTNVYMRLASVKLLLCHL